MDRSDKRRHENGMNMWTCLHVDAIRTLCEESGTGYLKLPLHVTCRLLNAMCARLKLVEK